jgi:2',3'-cyclic-nucleotide 2'-phosphodiesterase/3'-nucleotidase
MLNLPGLIMMEDVLKQGHLIFILFIFVTVSCTKEISIPVIVTTDIHGMFVSQENEPGSLASIATAVNEIRSKNKDLILLDNGDILQGTPALHYFNFIAKDRKHIVSQVMNHLKYDAASIGNHDIEAGFENCIRIEKEFTFPWLSGNMTLNETKMPLFKPFTIIERKGVRIAVLGMTTLTAQKAVRPENIEILYLNSIREMSEKWIRIIKQDHKADVIIGLFHEGLEFVKPVAESVKGFDIIFTGHDHTVNKETVKSPEGKEVLIVGSSDSGKSFVLAEIIKSKGIFSFKGDVVPIKKTSEDTGFIDFIEPLLQEAVKYESSVAGEAPVEITPEIYVDIIHETLLRITNAEVSLTAPVTDDVSLKAGNVTVRDLFYLYPFDNFPVTLKLSGKEIESLLKYSHELQKPGSRYKRFYNDISPRYTAAIPLEQTRLYTVVMNSYHASDGGEILSKGIGLDAETIKSRIVKIFPENIREHLFKTENR